MARHLRSTWLVLATGGVLFVLATAAPGQGVKWRGADNSNSGNTAVDRVRNDINRTQQAISDVQNQANQARGQIPQLQDKVKQADAAAAPARAEVEAARKDSANAQARVRQAQADLDLVDKRLRTAMEGSEPSLGLAKALAVASAQYDARKEEVLTALRATAEHKAAATALEDARKRMEELRGARELDPEALRAQAQAVIDAETALSRLEQAALDADAEAGPLVRARDAAQKAWDLQKKVNQDAINRDPDHRGAQTALDQAKAELKEANLRLSATLHKQSQAQVALEGARRELAMAQSISQSADSQVRSLQSRLSSLQQQERDLQRNNNNNNNRGRRN